jgi:hypothetical protein
MPSVSKKQHNFMEAIAHSKDFAKKVGVPQSVGKEFATADKGKKFKEGGTMKSVDMKKNPGMAKLPTAVRNKMGYMKKGGMAHDDAKQDMKMDKKQDKSMIKKAVGMHDKQQHSGKKTNLETLKKGGMSCAPKKMAMGGMARMASKGEHPVQKQAKRGAEMVKMAKGGLAAGHKSADGIATKGKTRAMRPEMRKGGKVC